ncbi:MAG: FAD-dependent monooxygenase [Pseudomonadota bacterium]
MDIFISGGGIAGLTAAAALGQAGFSVYLADPMLPVAAEGDDGSDMRTTAYLRPSVDLLERIGIWSALRDEATPLDVLQVIDTVGQPPVETERRAFRADDLGDGPFGWNLPNWLTRKVLSRLVAEMDGVTVRLGTGFRSMLVREREALVTLTDGTQVAARLVVGADGRMSPVRHAANVGVSVNRYGQKALAFAVTHEVPHGFVSTEIYNQGGAFTTVPAPDRNGQPSSAIVWMADGAEADRRMGLSPEALAEEATERSLGELGAMTVVSPVRAWPVVTQVADRLTARRVALIAEAAHVLPPIGAQGLNTSLSDVAALVAAAEHPLGEDKMLKAYSDARASDVRLRAGVIDLFNRVCKTDAAPVNALRRLGLRVVHDATPVRRAVMRAGLGG